MDLERFRAEFPITRTHAYLNHAAVAAPPLRATDAVRDYLERTQRTPPDLLLPETEALVARFRERVARLIGAARPDEVVPMPNTATGINTAVNSLPLDVGDNVLVLDGDYPAVIYPWLNLAPRGIETRRTPCVRGGLDLDRLASRFDAQTRAVALSTAMFSTGCRNDVGAVGRLCRERGAYLVVEGIQTLGAFDIDVRAAGIDILACGSHKWLLGIPGSGFLYCRRELLPELRLGAYVGAFSVVEPWDFLSYDFTLHDSAERFTLGTQNVAGIVALDASLALLEEAGMDAVSGRVLALTDLLVGDLERRGHRVDSPRDAERRSGIVVIESPEPEAARERLLATGVAVSVRGAGLRVSPHFYNTEEEVLRVGAALRESPVPSPVGARLV